MTLPTLFRRLRQQDTIDRLRQVVEAKERTLQGERATHADHDALDDAVWQWLQARIAMRAQHTDTDGTINTEQYTTAAVAVEVAERALDQAARKALMHPGLLGSWGRGVPRDWACDFDPQNGGPMEGGCECSGHGRTEETSRQCFYRFPVGEKERD